MKVQLGRVGAIAPIICVQQPAAKGEVRLRKTTADEPLEAQRRDEFIRLGRLNENIGKADQDIWERVA